jgi:hypothetical protein
VVVAQETRSRFWIVGVVGIVAIVAVAAIAIFALVWAGAGNLPVPQVAQQGEELPLNVTESPYRAIMMPLFDRFAGVVDGRDGHLVGLADFPEDVYMQSADDGAWLVWTWESLPFTSENPIEMEVIGYGFRFEPDTGNATLLKETNAVLGIPMTGDAWMADLTAWQQQSAKTFFDEQK